MDGAQGGRESACRARWPQSVWRHPIPLQAMEPPAPGGAAGNFDHHTRSAIAGTGQHIRTKLLSAPSSREIPTDEFQRYFSHCLHQPYWSFPAIDTPFIVGMGRSGATLLRALPASLAKPTCVLMHEYVIQVWPSEGESSLRTRPRSRSHDRIGLARGGRTRGARGRRRMSAA